uniref:Uncharacterized protein n=1 Tax=Arundo donax TaxID=35708 RepID=A0A0A9ES64_ARUDO
MDSSRASIVVTGGPTVPIMEKTFAIDVKHPAQLSVSPAAYQYDNSL